MAQLVEHILGKDEVPSSNLGSSSRNPPTYWSGALVFWSLADSRGRLSLQSALSLFCDRIQYCHSLLLLLCLFRFILFFVSCCSFGKIPQAVCAYPDRRSKSSLFRRRERVSSPLANTWARAPENPRPIGRGLWFFGAKREQIGQYPKYSLFFCWLNEIVAMPR